MALNVTLTFPRSQIAGFTVLHLDLREALSEPFELVLDVEHNDPALDMGTVVGERVLVALQDEALMPQLEGMVRRVRQLTSEPTGISQYELIVVPPLWMTTRRKDHRIFQHLTVPEIVAAVVAGYGGRIAPPVSALSGNHPKREYTVQYGETDHDFIFRLLADEGITSFFDHNSQSAFTLVDDTTLFTPTIQGQVPFVPPSAQIPTVDHVTSVAITSGIETSEIGVRDYDFEKPAFILESAAAASPSRLTNEAGLEVYEYEVGNFSLQPDADARANQLLEEARATSRILSCGTSFALAPATRFTLAGHPRSDVDGELLVWRTRTVQRSQTPGQTLKRHTLDCIPADQPFRPRRLPKPRIFGTQTAFVVGAPGEEIDVDQFGRVEIEFRWDRRDVHSGGISRRVRVSQGWAGAGFGFVMLPRVNEEVIVSYLDGDPDEPIVCGRVHNAFVTSPLNLPAQKTQSMWKSRSSPGGGGFNMIMMEDAAGAEVLEIRAQKDLRCEALRHATSTFGGNNKIDIKGDQETTISGQQEIKVGSQYTLDVGNGLVTSRDCMSVLATSNVIVTAGKDRIDATGVNHHIDAKGSVYAQAGSVIQAVAPNFHVFAGDSIILKCGGSVLKIMPGYIELSSPLIKLNS